MFSCGLLPSCFGAEEHQIEEPQQTNNSGQQNHPQTQSAFFFKLPSEIRLSIYSLAVSQYKNIDVIYESLTARQVTWPSDSAQYAARHTSNWHSLVSSVRWPKNNELQYLFLVCRRMHDEIADMIYSTRIFFFDTPKLVVDLQNTIPVRHFNRISSIRLVFCSNYASSRASEVNAETFKSALEILQQMPKLRSFHILLSHECWRDHFFIKTYPNGNHPYWEPEEMRSHLTPPAWFENPFERVFMRQAPVDFHMDDILPDLQWVKGIPCHGEVMVQLHVIPYMYAGRSAIGAAVFTGTTAMRLRDGQFIKI